MMYYIYIITNLLNTVLYTGITNNLERRIFEHKNGSNPKSFTKKYRIKKLVYIESFHEIEDAIAREKQIKSGSRKKKIELIEKSNKNWEDLSREWF